MELGTPPASFGIPFISLSLCLAIVCAYALLFIYRITYHPLSRFPGPVLARASYVYEFWFDVLRTGKFTHKVAQLHEIYGPIVRVNPDELHCNDPDFIDILYHTGKGKRNKSEHYLAAFPKGQVPARATVGTASHDEHRRRRAPVAKYFSRSRIAKHEDIIHDKAQRLCTRLLASDNVGPFQLTAAYSCFTTDTLTSYAFGHSLANLEQPGWHPTFKGTVDKMTGLFYLSRHLPVMASLAEYLPLGICRYISADISALLELIRVTIPKLVKQSMGEDLDTIQHPNVIDALLNADLAPSEKTMERITGEAVAVVLGGTHSISTVLSIATFHLLKDLKRQDRLREELREAVEDETLLPPWSTLEQLPYLNAVIQEALRLMHGVASRISQVAPNEDLVYVAPDNSSLLIPRGSAIGMSTYMVHNNPKIYPNPTEFMPERWLDKDGVRDRDLDKYMLSFSKGSRQCVGMHLAYCELHVALAALTLRVLPRMKLHDTTISDVAYDHDQLIAMPKKGSKGVQITMR